MRQYVFVALIRCDNTMIDRQNHYEKLAEEIFSQPESKRLLYIDKLKKRDRDFYDKMESLIAFSEKNQKSLTPEVETQIKKILSELKS